EIGKATVDKDGKWTVDKIPADKLVQGEKVTAEQTEKDKKPATEESTVAAKAAEETSAKPVITEPKAGDTSVSGTGVPGATVVLKDKDGKEIGKATVDKDGNWTVDNIPKDKLVQGEKVTAEQTEPGKKPATEEATVAKAQETSAKPTITEPKAGDTSVSGTGVPGATVVLKDKDGKEIGKATVDKDGKWTVDKIPADKLVQGEKVTAEQTEKDKKPATEE
uniref:Ig-like domain-containing protein n=1 Tax=Peptoniphilus gorbachii TaxID=411567 RepID=UPI003BA88C60